MFRRTDQSAWAAAAKVSPPPNASFLRLLNAMAPMSTTSAATAISWLAPLGDAIFVTGSLPILPDEFKKQLKIGGRLAVIVGDPPVMEARLVTRVTETSYDSASLFETSIPPLHNAPAPDRFVF